MLTFDVTYHCDAKDCSAQAKLEQVSLSVEITEESNSYGSTYCTGQISPDSLPPRWATVIIWSEPCFYCPKHAKLAKLSQ